MKLYFNDVMMRQEVQRLDLIFQAVVVDSNERSDAQALLLFDRYTTPPREAW